MEQGANAELPYKFSDEAALHDTSLFTPHADTDFEVRFWDVFGGTSQREFTPEEKLLLAVLIQAIDDLTLGTKGNKYREGTHWMKPSARRWFTEMDYIAPNGQPERGFSLEFVCEVLDLTVSVVRKAAMKRCEGDV